MKIIAFAGLAQSGKTTAADAVFHDLAAGDYAEPTIEMFAGPLKHAAITLGCPKNEQPDLYRKFCQEIVSNFRDPSYVRDVTGPDYWVQWMERRLTQIEIAEQEASLALDFHGLNEHYTESVVLIDDVRYMNELEMLRRWDACTVFIDASKRLGDLTVGWRQHESEALAYNYTTGAIAEDLFDFHITNNGRLCDFIAKVLNTTGDFLSYCDREWVATED